MATNNNELQVILDNKNVPAENAKQLLAAYGAPFIEAGKILKDYKKIVVTDESQTDIMAQARTKRLTLRKTRIEVENKRKELKSDYLAVTNAIDSVARYIKSEIEPAEEYLELQEKYAEIKQAERAATLKAKRTAALAKYTDDISIYNIDEMDEVQFDALLAELEAKAQAEIARQKAAADEAAKVAAEKLAEEKRIREENEKLKAEAEARAKKQAEIDEANEKQRQAEIARQAEIEAKAAAELAAVQAAADEERKKREAIEKAAADEKAAAAAAEAKAKADADAAAMAELLAPDKQKLITFAAALETIRVEKLPAVKTSQAQKVVTLIDEMLVKMQGIINDKAKEL